MGLLFLCVANSARSQMAEGLAKKHFPDLEVFSAGSEPSKVRPNAIKAMQEIGIDISQQYSKAIEDIDDHEIQLVITLCAEENCPVTFKTQQRWHWPMPDPANDTISSQEEFYSFCAVRDQIEKRLLEEKQNIYKSVKPS